MAYTQITPDNAETTYQVVLHRIVYSMMWREIAGILLCSSPSEARRHFRSPYGIALQHHVFGGSSTHKKTIKEDAVAMVKTGYPSRLIARTVRINEEIIRGWKKEEENKTKPKRQVLMLMIQGEQKSIQQIAKETGLKRACIYRRIQLGWSIEDVIAQRRRLYTTAIRITADGKTLTLHEWSRVLGVSYSLLYKRYRKRWPPEKILQRKRALRGRVITAFGESLTLREWAEREQMSLHALHYQLRKGTPIEVALTKRSPHRNIQQSTH